MGDFRDILERHLTRPIHRYIDSVRNTVADLNAILDSPAALDQFPGREQPYMFSRMWAGLPLTTPRRSAVSTGFEKLATVTNPSAYVLPREGSIKVGRIGSFVWEATDINTYISATWSADENSTLGVHTRAFSNGTADIFSSVVDSNGGALLNNNNRFVDILFGEEATPDVAADLVNTCFEIGLYDKLRGRYLHDGDRLPSAVFSGQTAAARNNGEPIRFDPNSDIEPRLYVNEIRMREVLDTDALFNAFLFKAYVHITFRGFLEQTDKHMGGEP